VKRSKPKRKSFIPSLRDDEFFEESQIGGRKGRSVSGLCRIVDGNEGSDDGMPTTPRRRALGDVAPCWAAAVRLGDFKEKARDGFLRAGSTIFAMMLFCQ
jgi:hypothetical protein